jgi:hypothetical protein
MLEIKDLLGVLGRFGVSGEGYLHGLARATRDIDLR